ncbi:hypothetical protein M885DRAFT_515206 [Pelagophyceae sp. CCMP2097]|nr:hypothetical protein M885DRAFT_515206 [Pelagophyceae sp. CCMP2097]
MGLGRLPAQPESQQPESQLDDAPAPPAGTRRGKAWLHEQAKAAILARQEGPFRPTKEALHVRAAVDAANTLQVDDGRQTATLYLTRQARADLDLLAGPDEQTYPLDRIVGRVIIVDEVRVVTDRQCVPCAAALAASRPWHVCGWGFAFSVGRVSVEAQSCYAPLPPLEDVNRDASATSLAALAPRTLRDTIAALETHQGCRDRVRTCNAAGDVCIPARLDDSNVDAALDAAFARDREAEARAAQQHRPAAAPRPRDDNELALDDETQPESQPETQLDVGAPVDGAGPLPRWCCAAPARPSAHRRRLT